MDVHDRGGRAAGQVESHEAAVPEGILHVVAEEPERPLVGDEVPPPAVEEHRGENGEPAVHSVRVPEPLGNEPVGVHEAGQRGPRLEFQHEHEDRDQNQRPRHERVGIGVLGVLQGDHA